MAHPNDTPPALLTIDHVLGFVRRHGWRLVLAGLLGGVLGGALSFGVAKQWQAQATLQVGRVFSQGSPLLVERPAETVARLQLEAFRDRVLQALSLPLASEDSAETAMLRNSLRAGVLRTTDLVTVGVRAPSAEQAEKWLAAVNDILAEDHGQLLRPSVQRLENELKDIEADYPVALARRDALYERALAGTGTPGEWSAMESVMRETLINQLEQSVRTLQLRRATVAEQLSPDLTFNTRPMDGVDVSRRPVFPSRPLFAVVGAVLAGLLVFVVCVVCDYRRARAARPGGLV